MKRNQIETGKQPSHRFTFYILSIIASFVFILLFSSCASFITPMAAVKGEEFGGGLEAGVGALPITENLMLNAVAGYHYYGFSTGHDNFMKVGAQVRHQNQILPLWFGGELCVVRDVSIYDESYWDDNPSANGISVGAIAGYQLPVESLDMSVFTGLSVVSFGDFKADGSVVESGHSPLQFRIGLEIGLPFSK